LAYPCLFGAPNLECAPSHLLSVLLSFILIQSPTLADSREIRPNNIGGETTFVFDTWGDMIEKSDTDSQGRVRQVCRYVENPARLSVTYYRADGTVWKRMAKRVLTRYEAYELENNRETDGFGRVIVRIEDIRPGTPVDWENTPDGTTTIWYGPTGNTIIFERRRADGRVQHREGVQWVDGPGLAPGERREDTTNSLALDQEDRLETSEITEAATGGVGVADSDMETAPAVAETTRIREGPTSVGVRANSPGVDSSPTSESLENRSLADLTTILLNKKQHIENVHGYGNDKSVAHLRTAMEAEGVQSGLQFCQSWGDSHALLYLNEVIPRLRPTLRRLQAAQKRKNLSEPQRLALRKEALDAIMIASELERLLDHRLRGLAVSALFWDKSLELKEMERRAKGDTKKQIRALKRELEEARKESNFENVRRYSLHIEALPYPKT